MRNSWLCLGALTWGCSSAVVPAANDAAVTADGATALDVTAGDTPPSVDDVSAGPDAQPPVDVSAARDVPAGPDAAPPNDSGTPVDAPAGPVILGRWRAVAITVSTGTGERVRLTDVDQPVVTDPSTGMTAPFRANGFLTLEETRLSMAFGLLASGYFYASTDASGMDSYSASGVTVPGLYDPATQSFNISGGASAVRFTVASADRISYTDPGSGSVTEYERVTALGLARTTVNSVAGAQLRHPTSASPFTRPRAAVLWAAPAGSARVETHGYAITFMGNFASMPLVLGSTPEASVIHTVDGVSAAVGYPIVYDDLDGDGRFDGATDVLRGVSPVVIVWTEPGASLSGTRFREVQAGYVFAHAHTDYTRGADGFAPFATTREVGVNVPVEDGRVTAGVPNAMR
ncbi:MAG: hypothetical protein R3A52_16905 [Polyangiales bacterium]